MKNKVCICISGETDKSNVISIEINVNGMNIDYSAYSTDSSFSDEIIPINFCPFCGNKLSDIPELRKKYSEKLEKLAIAKKEKEAKDKLLLIEAINKEKMDRIRNILANGIHGHYQEYSLVDTDIIIEAYNKKDAKMILLLKHNIDLSNKEAKIKLKHIKDNFK